MKMFVTIWLLFVGVAAGSQDMEGWKKLVQKQILEQSKSDSILRTTRFTITPVPICYYPCSGADLFAKKKMCRPVIDSFASFAFLMQKEKVTGVAENRGTGKYGFYLVPEQIKLKRKESDDNTWQMLKLAMSFSSQYCFIYFLPEERNRYEVLAVVKGGKTLFIDRELKIYRELSSLLTARYGSQKQAQETLDEQFIKKKLQKELSLDEAKKITEDDYVQYARRHPQDTIRILRLFLEEFSKYVPLEATEKTEIEKNILFNLAQAPLYQNNKKDYRIPFLDRNIFVFVKPFATESQLNEYKKYRTFRNWLIKKAYERLDAKESL